MPGTFNMDVFQVQKCDEAQEKVNYCEEQKQHCDVLSAMNNNDFENEGNNLIYLESEKMDIVTQACQIVSLSPFKQSPLPKSNSSIIFSPGTNAFYQNMSTLLETIETNSTTTTHQVLPPQELHSSQFHESQNCPHPQILIPAQSTSTLQQFTPIHFVTNVLPRQSCPPKTNSPISCAALPVNFNITEDTNTSPSVPSNMHYGKSGNSVDYFEDFPSTLLRVNPSRPQPYEELSEVGLEVPTSTFNSYLMKYPTSPSHLNTAIQKKCPFKQPQYSPLTTMLHALTRVPAEMKIDTPVKDIGFLSDLIKSSTESQVSSTEPSTSPKSGNKDSTTSYSEGEVTTSTPIISSQPCPICNKKISKRYLKMHIRLHSNQQANHCSNCSKKYTYKLVVKDSALKTFKKKLFQCEDCGKQYVKQKNFNMKRRQHALNYRFKNKTFGLRKIASEKITDSCSETTGEQEGKQIIKKKTANLCPICGKIFAGQTCLKVHQRVHMREMPFECHNCDKRFRFKHSFNKHLEEHQHIDLHERGIFEKKYDKQNVHKPGHEEKGNSVSEDITLQSLAKSNKAVAKDSQKVSDKDIEKMTNMLRNKNLFKKVGKKFKCLVCNKMFIKRHLLNKHLKVHEETLDDNVKVFTCSVCYKELSNLTLLRDHIMKHALKIFEESISSETLMRSPGRLEMNGKADCKEYSVEDSSDEQSGHLIDGINESDVIPSDASVEPSLPVKKKPQKHKSTKPLKINHENRTNEKLETNNNLPAEAVDNITVDNGNNIVDESDCLSDQAKDNLTDVVSAVRKRKGKKQHDDNLKCYICGKEAKCPRNLKSHMKCHNHSSFVCEKCGRVYKYEKYLKRHLLSHEKQNDKKKRTEQGRTKCNHCHKSVRPDSMKTHMRTHTGERPFQCHHCGARFKQVTHLKTHFRTHTGEKPYQCPNCGKVFRKSGNLIIHMRNHTGERPYECEECQATFKHLALFKEHMASHQGIILYQCELCGHKYKSRSGYDSHKRRHHQHCSEYRCYLCGIVYKTSYEVKNCSCSISKNSSSGSGVPKQPFQEQEASEITSVEHLPETSVKSFSYACNSISDTVQSAVSLPISSVYSCMMDVLNNPVDTHANNELRIIENNSYQHQ